MIPCLDVAGSVDALYGQKLNWQENRVLKKNGDESGQQNFTSFRVGNYCYGLRTCISQERSIGSRLIGIPIRCGGYAHTETPFQWQVCLYAQILHRVSKNAGVAYSKFRRDKCTLSKIAPHFSF